MSVSFYPAQWGIYPTGLQIENVDIDQQVTVVLTNVNAQYLLEGMGWHNFIGYADSLDFLSRVYMALELLSAGHTLHDPDKPFIVKPRTFKSTNVRIHNVKNDEIEVYTRVNLLRLQDLTEWCILNNYIIAWS